MPFGAWANFAACKRDMEAKQGYTDEQSDKVCGSLKAKLEKGKAFHTGSRPRVTSTAVNRTRRGDKSGDMRVNIDGKKYSRKAAAILLPDHERAHKGEIIDNFLVKGKTDWYESEIRLGKIKRNGTYQSPKRNALIADIARTREKKGTSDTHMSRDMDRERRVGLSTGAFKNLTKAKSDQELPRAEKKEKKVNPETDPVPIPQYERPDKCSDELTTPPEKKIKKIEKDRLGGGFTDSHGDTMYSRGKPTGSVSYDDKGTGTVVHRKKGNWLTTDSPNQTGDVVSRSKQKDTTTRAGRRFMRKGEVIGNFLVKGFDTHRYSGVKARHYGTMNEVRVTENWHPGKTERQRHRESAQSPERKGDAAEGLKNLSKNECPCAGAKVEMEHKDTLLSLGIPEDRVSEAAQKIAADHIKEDPEYYKKLKQMESVNKAEVDPDPEEAQIRQLRLKSRLSPSIKDLKEVQEVQVKEVKKDDVKKEWALDLETLMKSDREFSGTFHKPVIDKENDIIPASAMDKAMDDFMILPTLQEVHTERPVGIITKAWKNGEDEYYLEGKIKPGDDCDDVWQKIKKGEYDGLSIGGRRVNYSKECAIPSLIRDTPCVTHRLKLYNVSVCSSPVNPEASIDEFNKVAKSETGVGEEVFDLTETLKKAMTAGTSGTTGSNLNHGIFDGRKKNVKEDVEKGTVKENRAGRGELRGTKLWHDYRSGKDHVSSGHGQEGYGRKESISQRNDRMRKGDDMDVDKGAWTAKRGIASGLQQTSMRAAEVRPRTAQRPNNQNRVLRANQRAIGKSTIHQLIDSINEISKSFTRPGRMIRSTGHEVYKVKYSGSKPSWKRTTPAKDRYEHETKKLTKEKLTKGMFTHKKKQIRAMQSEGREPQDNEARGTARSELHGLFNSDLNKKVGAEGLKNMTKSDDDDQKPIRQSEKAKRKDKLKVENYHDGKLEKGDTMDEEVDDVENVEYVEKGDDELITKSDIDALTDAIMGLQKSFESYFSTLTVPQPQKLSGKGHEVTDTMQKSEDEYYPDNNVEVIAKAYDDKIKALEEKISKMENTTIRKGGEAVIIPEQLQSNDTVLTNMSILNGIGRMSK